MAGLLELVAGLFKPAADLVDNLHTSEEERGQVKNVLFAAQAELSAKALDYERQILDAQAAIIKSEAAGQSWMQRNWRPVTMLTFLVLVVCDSFGLLAFRLAQEAWTLLQLGLGGYVVGRSVEKIMPAVASMAKGKG